MGNSTKATVENMTIASADLASTIAELKASIASLNALVESLKSDNEYLKNNNDLLREENAYLKRKLFGVKSEKMPCSVEQLSLLMKQNKNANQSFLKKLHTKELRRNRKVLLKSS
ncbi:transposase domain-containing protein [Catenibacterium sp.]|uniref:transposase domain-containing protein n=1 Tax=Catenibacterium sp. TaxID=2049022 RepID=UPI00399440F2